MQIGATCGMATSGSLKDVIASAIDFETRGFSSMWMVQAFGLDSINALSIAGRETKSIELGTSVVPTFTRHPVTMAQQALTTAVSSGGRFTLGVGLSHKMIVEDMYGLSYDKPAKHMREYLSVLGPLLKGEQVSYEGELYNVNFDIGVTDAPKSLPILLAALGPVMLKLAGALADGTVTWLTGLDTLENHIVPSVTKAAREAGKPAPRIVAGLPILLTNDPNGARESLSNKFQLYDSMPSYQAMLEREGATGAADVAILGDETVLDAAITRLKDMGITDFRSSITGVEEGSVERTLDYLASKISEAA